MRAFFTLLVFSLYLSAPLKADENAGLAGCWSCTASHGSLKFSRFGATRNQAARNSLRACRVYSSNCKVSSCSAGMSCSTPAPHPLPSPRQCTINLDCAAPLEVCLNGRCVPKQGFDNQCHSDFECGFPNKCIGGRCGQSGVDGCSSNVDCPGQQCVNRACVPLPPPTCFSDAQCFGHFHCVGGTCIP